MYGVHPRGVLDLISVVDMEKPSALVDDFVTIMKDIHKQVKDKLQHTTKKYKEYSNKKRRELHF